jgi:hypothetical protein
VRLMNDDDRLSPQVGRYGEHVRGGGVSFRCAACGEMAAVVRLVRAGTTVNMGPPLGEQAYDRDGVVVDFWLGSTCWRRLDPARWARIEQVLAAGQPDPAGLHQIDWELAGLLVPGLPALLLPRRLAEDRCLGWAVLRLHRRCMPGRTPPHDR